VDRQEFYDDADLDTALGHAQVADRLDEAIRSIHGVRVAARGQWNLTRIAGEAECGVFGLKAYLEGMYVRKNLPGPSPYGIQKSKPEEERAAG
jgi:hypothetical protein